jgi:hypothetical protein
MSSEILKSFLEVYTPFTFETLRVVYEKILQDWKLIESLPEYRQNWNDFQKPRVVAKSEYSPPTTKKKKRCLPDFLFCCGDLKPLLGCIPIRKKNLSDSDSDFEIKNDEVDKIVEQTTSINISQAAQIKEDITIIDQDFWDTPEIVHKFYTFASDSFKTRVYAENLKSGQKKVAHNFAQEMRKQFEYVEEK